MAQIALVCFYQYFGTTCFKSSENAFSPTTLTSKNPTKTNKTILWLKGFTVKDVLDADTKLCATEFVKVEIEKRTLLSLEIEKASTILSIDN